MPASFYLARKSFDTCTYVARTLPCCDSHIGKNSGAPEIDVAGCQLHHRCASPISIFRWQSSQSRYGQKKVLSYLSKATKSVHEETDEFPRSMESSLALPLSLSLCMCSSSVLSVPAMCVARWPPPFLVAKTPWINRWNTLRSSVADDLQGFSALSESVSPGSSLSDSVSIEASSIQSLRFRWFLHASSVSGRLPLCHKAGEQKT